MKKYVFESLKFFCAAILCTILSTFATPSWGANCNLFDGTITHWAYTTNPNRVNVSPSYMGITLPVTENKTYTFSRATAVGNRFVRYFTTDVPVEDMAVYDVNPNIPIDTLTHTFTVPAGMKYVVFYFDVSGADISNSKMQLEEGTTATAYTPYNPLCATCDGTIVNYVSATGTVSQSGTPTPTNPIYPTFYTQGNMVLRAVGDYKDTFDATTGKITRRVGVKVFDGTETDFEYSNGRFTFLIDDEFALPNTCICTHYVGVSSTLSVVDMSSGQIKCGYTGFANKVYFKDSRFTTAAGMQNWLAEQYAAGTPVTIYYPLATAVEEDWPASYCETPIKIATTKYNETKFSPLNTALQNAISVVDSVVSNTITQSGRIATLQTQKQTRPADDPSDANNAENCPEGKKCLLVTDENKTPHWYEIFDPIHEWYEAWVTAGKPAVKGTQTDGKWTFYNAFYSGDKTWRKTYIDGSTSTYDRPFAHATRCTNPSYNTETQKARPCYSEVGMFKTLGDGEWAEVYTSDDGTNSPVGVVYGTSKCTSVGGPTNYANGGTPLSQLSAADQAKWAELPAPVGQEEREGYERGNFNQCWCRASAVGVPGADGNPANGSIYPVGASSWVFRNTDGSAASCAYNCARDCAAYVRYYASFRSAVFGGLE